ncbi:uncharacterized protein LOC141708754 [Apium graveolens]|uniref:uncharacterized protein LOC141708754 n=1 Tax=Apium graveolens TaxID=4045 RepID=UPI003D78B6F5
MEKRINNTKRKRRKKPSPSSLSGHAAGKNLFAVMLASLHNHQHNSPESNPILTQCLNRLSVTLISKFPNPFISLFPLLLRSNCDEIAIRSLEIVGAACLYSLELNEKFALDDEIIRSLINVVGNSKRKKIVALAACNATLDLSSTSIARRCLLQFSGLESFISQFNQVPKCSGAQLCLYKEEKGSSKSVKIGFREDKYLVLLLYTIVTLLNTCIVEQLERIPKNLSENLVVYLKSLWAEVQKQMLLVNILDARLMREFYLSKITPNNLAESIFRLSVNDRQLPTTANHEKVERSIFNLGETSFECFMLNYWETLPLHMRGHSKSINNIFSSFVETVRPQHGFPTFLSPMLQKSISTLPIYSDELDILNFLDDVRDHLACPIIYQQDIRVLKTDSGRETHFFSEHLGSCFPQAPNVLYFNDILRCEEAFKEGYSIAMRGMEFRFKSIAAVADDLASFFGQPSVGVNMYLTPPNSQGLACHYDDHCVFVCQLIGIKRWKVFHRPSLQLPRLYDPINKLENEEMVKDGSTQVLLKEGDVLYIPRGVPHEACTVNNDESDEIAKFSLHLTLAIEVEPPFEWEGFIHVALHHWGQTQYLCRYTSADALSIDLSVLAVNLMHIVIKTVAATDATYRKACLVGAVLSPSVSEGWLNVNKKTTFRHLLNKVNTQSRFTDAVSRVEAAVQNHEDPLHDIRWLQHLYGKGELIKRTKWNSPLEETESYAYLVGQHIDKAESAFMHASSQFCSEVIFEDIEHSYKMLLEKYKHARNQYRDGMLSLHCN